MDIISGIAVNSIAAALLTLQSFATFLLTKTLDMRLCKSNTVITPSTTLGNLTQAAFGGYVPFHVTSFNGPFLDSTGNPYMSTNVAPFAANGTTGPDVIYAVYLTASTGSAATATATESGGAVTTITVTAGGSGYQAPPVVTITDATTGTGATAHAVLTAGVVTSIVIDTPGTLYTGPIITIEAPCELIGGFNLTTPQSMGLATDGLPAVMQIN